MSGILALILRILLLVALYGFLGWALLILWREIASQGFSLSKRQTPKLALTIRYGNSNPITRNFTQPVVTIGRHPNCDIALMDENVSVRHAQFTYHHNQWWLEDLSSTNGTLLNQIQVTTATVLTTGDEIQCGDTHLVVSPAGNLSLSQPYRSEAKT